MNRNFVPPQELAEQACHIEIDLLKEPVGKQDQYISAFGGITCFEFLPDDRVVAEPLKIAAETLANLEDNMLLFFTGAFALRGGGSTRSGPAHSRQCWRNAGESASDQTARPRKP